MASINDAKKLLEIISNKEQNGQLSIDRFNQVAPAASYWFFNDCYGQPVLSKNGLQTNDMFWQSNKKISDNLRHLITLVDLAVNSKGRSNRPTNFLHTSSIRFAYKVKISDSTQSQKAKFTTTEVQVTEVQDGEIAERLSSPLIPPTLQYPICCIYENYLQLYPQNVGMLKFTYLRKPNIPVWGYTLTNGRPVYNSSASVDFDFPDECLNELVMRMTSLLGINISNQLLLQYSQSMKQQGV